MGVAMCFSRSSSSLTVSMTLKPWRAQDGQETMFTPRWRRLSDFRMSKPTRTSSTGSADSDTRMVSPMPLHSSMPMPMEDLTVPEIMPPASVMPTCSGQSIASRQRLIGRHRQERVGRLHRNLVFVEIQVIENLGVVERAFDHRFGAGLAIFLQQVRFQRAGIDADAHGAAMVLGRLHHFLHALGRADIAGIDAQAGGAVHRRLDGALVVEMDVGHDRNGGTPW